MGGLSPYCGADLLTQRLVAYDMFVLILWAHLQGQGLRHTEATHVIHESPPVPLWG